MFVPSGIVFLARTAALFMTSYYTTPVGQFLTTQCILLKETDSWSFVKFDYSKPGGAV